jgi:hypothetical protein
MKRREFIALLGGAVALPMAARAQQPTVPVVGYLSTRSPDESAHIVTAFRNGLNETGYFPGQNVAIEYRFAEGRYDRLSGLAADLVRRPVNVLVEPIGKGRFRPGRNGLGTGCRARPTRSVQAKAPTFTAIAEIAQAFHDSTLRALQTIGVSDVAPYRGANPAHIPAES